MQSTEKYKLSILIPSRNEMFLNQTIADILSNIEGDTEIIAVLDGALPTELPQQHERVTVIYNHTSIGQRAATNQACRASNARWVMKCDAHVAFDKGFDVKMMKEMEGHDNWIMIPRMYNLHAFDWLCDNRECNHRIYQGPTPEKCPQCGNTMQRDIVWKPRLNRMSDHMRFDSDLHFQYWHSFRDRAESKGDIVPTMSLLGACFMLTREKYWEWNICDEKHGSWGQQGTEVACKAWLSGGALMTNKKTWFAHMFRTQGGDFGFPYPMSGHQVDTARTYSRKLWLENTWPLAIHPLQWLVDKFAPVPGWEVLKKGIVYYSSNDIDEKIMNNVQSQISKAEIPIVSATLQSTEFGKNIVLQLQKGPLTMFKQILKALEESDADIIYFCEHDVLYHPSHFEFVPIDKSKVYYNQNVWQTRVSDGFAVKYDCKRLSQLCGYRDVLIKHYKERVRRVELEGFSARIGYEPGSHNRVERIDDLKSDIWNSKEPNVDLKHDKNLTSARWSQDKFRDKRNCQHWQVDVCPAWAQKILKIINDTK